MRSEFHVGEGILRSHPLLESLRPYLEKKHVEPDLVEFLTDRLHFVYPRTLWFGLGVSESEELKLRHELDPLLIGRFLHEWIRASGEIRSVVFDLQNVTMLDQQKLIALIESARGRLPAFLLAQGQIAELFKRRIGLRSLDVFENRGELLEHLRRKASERNCQVPLPDKLTLDELEKALEKSADSKRLEDADLLTFDFGAVRAADFPSLTILGPTIHSLAQSHGILGAVENVHPKIDRLLRRHDSLRVIKPFLLNYREEPGPSPGAASDIGTIIVPVSTFSADVEEDVMAIQDVCLQQFNTMLIEQRIWFADFLGVTGGSTGVLHAAELVKDFRQVVKELVENVAMHAEGLGFFSLELNPVRDEGGLSIYVGDTGIGLGAGVSRAYKLPSVKTDLDAVQMLLQLKDQRHRRRFLDGEPAPGGRGLERVRLILEKWSGNVRVRSGSATAEFLPSKSRMPTVSSAKAFFLRGTHIHVRIPSPRK